MNTITTPKNSNLELARKMINLNRRERKDLDLMEHFINLFEVWITPSIKITHTLEDMEPIELHEIYLWGPELHRLLNSDNKKNMVFVTMKAGVIDFTTCSSFSISSRGFRAS
jgi:hypothetical protein